MIEIFKYYETSTNLHGDTTQHCIFCNKPTISFTKIRTLPCCPRCARVKNEEELNEEYYKRESYNKYLTYCSNIKSMLKEIERDLTTVTSVTVTDKCYTIVLPFLDHRNDYIQIYIQLDKDHCKANPCYRLTDNADTLEDLAISGIDTHNDKVIAAVKRITRAHDISIVGNVLISKVKDTNLLAPKTLVFAQSVIALNNLYYAFGE